VRIAFVAPLVAPLCDATSRGPHVIVADLARALLARGHDVMVFCAQGSFLSGVPTAPIVIDASVTSAFQELYWHVHQWDPDVIAQHAFEVDAIALCDGVPIVNTLHANPTDDVVVDAVRACQWPAVAVSHDSRQRWLGAGVARTVTITNGVPEMEWERRGPDPIALIAGRIAPEKGTAAAIRVAKRAGLEPVLVGEVYDRGYFAREVVPLLDRAHVFRTLPRQRVAALMQRAAVTLMPVEWDEPFGLVAAEAQIAGCPVVGYARGALPEVVATEGGVLVTPGDEDALVDAVPEARGLERLMVRESARDRFDMDTMVDAYEELLAETATGMRHVREAAA
jgi:glycosyltransferase involved in cell wall biosynthesis